MFEDLTKGVFRNLIKKNIEVEIPLNKQPDTANIIILVESVNKSVMLLYVSKHDVLLSFASHPLAQGEHL